MAFIAPFRALRPTPASAARVAAVPYDVVSAQEAHALAAGNPLSFLHVSRAEIDLPAQTDPYSDAVYRKAVENFATLKRRTYGLDALTGKRVWTYPDGAFTPVVTDGQRLYLVGWGKVYAFSPRK